MTGKKEIRLDRIGSHLDGQVQDLVKRVTFEWARQVIEETPIFSLSNYTKAELDSMPMFFKVNGKTVPLKKALLERPSGGTLAGAWQTNVSKPYVGKITNTTVYAEPVCYGTNLPPSWKEQFKTRQSPGTRPGFPDLISKELQPWISQQYERIKRRS